MRKTGQTNALVLQMAKSLNQNKTFGLAGCKDPADILKRLEEKGVKAIAKPMTITPHPETICDEYGVIGIKYGEKKITGYIFTKP